MITLQDVKGFLKEEADNPEVKTFMATMAPAKEVSAEDMLVFAQTPEGKTAIQPLIDQKVTDAIKTHDEKIKAKTDAAIKAGVAAEMIRLNPSETPEQKRLRELEEKDRKRDEEWERAKLDSRIKEIAFREGIRPEFLQGISFGSLEEATLFIQNFKKEKEQIEVAKINELAALGRKPESGINDGRKIDVSKLSLDQAIRMEMDGELDNAIA
jgi:hypothetical protein